MSHLSISLLGCMTVSLDGQPVTGFGYEKVKALLGYLVVEADRRYSVITLEARRWASRMSPMPPTIPTFTLSDRLK